jgi:hypothetical protein
VARIRTIKPEFPHSESMGRVSRESRLCFILLWTIADDAGRLRGNSRMLASLLYPYDDDAKNKIDGWLTQLAGEGCIDRYEVDGTSYIQVRKWSDHQKIDKPSQSRLPAFDESSRSLAKVSEASTTDLGPRTVDLVPRTNTADQPEGFDLFWQTYPKKSAKPAALKAFQSAKINGHLPEVLADVEAKAGGDDWQKENGKYVPNPATYLNQRRWEDETPSTAQQIPGLM